MTYTVHFNDTDNTQLAACKPWWIRFVRNIVSRRIAKSIHDLLEEELEKQDVKFNRISQSLTFKSEAHFTWFLLNN